MTTQAKDDLEGSSDRFGYEWDTYAEILPEHEEQFRRWTAPLSPQDWRGKDFLDVGCGMGRNSYWPLKYGADSGVAVDVDERSLERARRNLQSFSRIQVMRASAYELPFEERFDLAFSIGVIYHLEHPQRALEKMVHAVKPSGRVLIWVYGRGRTENMAGRVSTCVWVRTATGCERNQGGPWPAAGNYRGAEPAQHRHGPMEFCGCVGGRTSVGRRPASFAASSIGA